MVVLANAAKSIISSHLFICFLSFVQTVVVSQAPQEGFGPKELQWGRKERAALYG